MLLEGATLAVLDLEQVLALFEQDLVDFPDLQQAFFVLAFFAFPDLQQAFFVLLLVDVAFAVLDFVQAVLDFVQVFVVVVFAAAALAA